MKQVGSSAQAIGERQGEDYYETEPAAIDELLSKERFNHKIWEPACGKRSLSRRLEEHGYEVRDSDIVVRPCDKPTEKLDFMECLDSWDGDIITNPPFKIATDFILHALGLVREGAKVAMFLRLQFLEGRSKYRRLYERFPPKAIYVCSDRLNCAKNGDFEKYKLNNYVAYAWFVWEKGYKGLPTLDWINTGKKGDEPKLEDLWD